MTLTVDMPQIGDIQTPEAKHTNTNPTTRSHPPLILPTPRNLIDLHQMGNATTTANTRHISSTFNTLLNDDTAINDHPYFAAAEVMTIIHEYHDIATDIWPMQSPRQDTTKTTQIRSPITTAGLR
jgi:hypothetical protein